jgi:hypothetical protein
MLYNDIMSMPSENIQFSPWAVQQAIASLKLEGLEAPVDVVEDLNQIIQGQMTLADGLKRAYDRFSNDQILQPRPLP